MSLLVSLQMALTFSFDTALFVPLVTCSCTGSMSVQHLFKFFLFCLKQAHKHTGHAFFYSIVLLHGVTFQGTLLARPAFAKKCWKARREREKEGKMGGKAGESNVGLIVNGNYSA